MSVAQSTYHHGNLKEALLEEALRQLCDVGAEKLSLRALARSIGVSQTAPYRHFSDKTDLLACLAAAGFRQLTEFTLSSIRGAESATEMLHVSGKAYVKFALENAELYRLMFGPMIPPDLEHEELRTAGNQALESFIRIIQGGIDRGEFRAEDPRVWANTCWGMVHGIASLLIDGRFNCTETEFLEEDLDKALAVVQRGISAGHP